MKVKTVLVTGATGDIGTAIAESFAKNGYNVVVHTFSKPDFAREMCEKFEREYSVKALPVTADISVKSDVDKMFSLIDKKMGCVDVLVNNAGISQIKMLCDVTEEDWDRMFDVNVKGAYLCTNACTPYMVHNKWGRIINISSVWGVAGASCEVHYSASKSALVGFTKALSKELAPSGITVNCVCPGFIDTKMNSALSEKDVSDIVSDIPSGRTGTCEDVANAVMFFAKEESSYITGQTINVDGGWQAS